MIWCVSNCKRCRVPRGVWTGGVGVALFLGLVLSIGGHLSLPFCLLYCRDLLPIPPSPGDVPSCAEGGVLGVLPGVIGCIQVRMKEDHGKGGLMRRSVRCL